MANIITTLQPNLAGTYQSGDLVGAASRLIAISDDQESSYIRHSALGVYDNTFWHQVFAPSNPLKVVIDNFKIITRRACSTAWGQSGNYTYTMIRVNTTNYLYNIQGPCGVDQVFPITNFTTTLTLNPLTGLPWTIADINNTQIGARIATPKIGGASFIKAYCQIEYHYLKSSRSCVLIRKK